MAKKENLSLQTKDIIKILELCSGSIIEFRYGDLSIRLNPYLNQNPYDKKYGSSEQESQPSPLHTEPKVPLIPEENTSTQSQDALDDELELDLIGMEDPGEYFKQLEQEEIKRAKANR